MGEHLGWVYYDHDYNHTKSLDRSNEIILKSFRTNEQIIEYYDGKPGPEMEHLIFDERDLHSGINKYYTVEQWNRGVEKYESFRNASIVVGAACVVAALLYIAFKIYDHCTDDQNTQNTPERYIPQGTRRVESFVPSSLELRR